MVLGTILGETFKYEVAQIIDTTGVFLLNLKSPIQQVTHTHVHGHRQQEKQGGVPGKKWHEKDGMEPARSLGGDKGLPGAGTGS